MCLIFGAFQKTIVIPPLVERGLYCNHLVRPSVSPSVRPSVCPSVHTFVIDITPFTGRNDFIFDICLTLAWWLVPCLPFPGLPHIYFLFTVRLIIFHVCRNEHFRNSYLSFYWKKWFYIWYIALVWWLVPCLPFPGSPHNYFLFTVRLTNEWVGVFLARRSMCNILFYFGAFQMVRKK